MSKQIVVEIDQYGTVHMDAQGFTGNACERATETIEIALGGGEQASKKKKPEYYRSALAENMIKRTF